jgi:hypothetical protein
MKNQKEKLMKIIKKTGESLNSDIAKKIDFQQLESVTRRLVQFFDECKECQEYTDMIIKYIEDTNKFSDFEDKQELKNFNHDIEAIVSHMQSKHKLITDGYYMSIGLVLGTGIGIASGSAFNNVSIGISVGMCIGLAVGAGVDAYYRKKGQVL